MALNKTKGNMYEFVTHTWNTIKGKCYHDCSYCYMKRFGKQNQVRLDVKELKTDLGSGNFIFIGSSCDMFAKDIPEDWIRATLKHMEQFDNKYLLQTKNPERVLDFIDSSVISEKCIVCTTIESDVFFTKIMGNSPHPIERSKAMLKLSDVIDTYVTIEPILDFNLQPFVKIIKRCRPKQVNIGADTGRNNLIEPSRDEILMLISELEKFTVVHKKANLKRLIQ